MTEYLLSNDSSKCYGCRVCEKVCPQKAIDMKPNDEGFLYPVLDGSLCVKCGLCSKTCPHDNTNVESEKPISVYAAQNKQEEALHYSSSGGVFSAMADYVLGLGGAVAGCVLDENFRACHVVTENHAIVKKMRGSKYVQSDTQSTYVEMKQRLEQGQIVIFTGTPCQVDGLKRFLRKDYDNLFTVDLICHGVPSPALFAEYLKDTEQKKGMITDIKFRNKKRNGWCSQGSLSYLKGKNEKTYTISPFNTSYYYYYYLQNNVNRMSCYSCKYSAIKRVGDISIGDFWNINDVLPDVDTSKGISVVLVNSEQGLKLVAALKDRLLMYETELILAIKGNSNLSKPCDQPDSRNNIYKRIKDKGYATIAKQDCKYQYVIPFLRKHTPRALKNHLKKIKR